jgi:hypothetical protein
MRHAVPAALLLIATAGLAALPASAPAQMSAQGPSARADADANAAKARTLRALSRRVSLDVRDQPIDDVFRFIAEVTGAELEPLYLTDTEFEGIDPETTVTVRATEMPALALLERVLKRAEQIERPASAYTWQLTETGSVEFGPKSLLNRDQTIELYDLADLLFVVPRFDNAPEFDLSSALQSSQGGGGGSPFQTSGDDEDDEPVEDRVAAIVNLLETNIEPEQWANAGGDGASVSFLGTSLVVTAPDYIHRQINGYSFWPARLQQVRVIDGRRQVQIRPDPKADGRQPRPTPDQP